MRVEYGERKSEYPQNTPDGKSYKQVSHTESVLREDLLTTVVTSEIFDHCVTGHPHIPNYIYIHTQIYTHIHMNMQSSSSSSPPPKNRFL